MSDIEASRWDAVRRRDKNATFIFGVATTRVACRPGCPARTPRLENLRFFEDFAAAQVAGFRACKRCAPNDVAADADRQRSVARACALMDDDEALSLEAVSRAVGLSRFHFQRIFRAVLGVTPGEYRRARREERLRVGLSDGRSVTDAIQAAGFGSASRAYEAEAFGMTPSAFRAGARGERIAYAVGASSLGRVLVARTPRGVCAIELGDDDPTVLAALRRDFPHADLVVDDRDLAHNLGAVLALIDHGKQSGTALEFDVRGTAFQRRVWKRVARYSPGRTLVVRKGRRGDRQSRLGARRRSRLRRQPPGRRHPVPPCRGSRRRTYGLSLGRRPQGGIATA